MKIRYLLLIGLLAFIGFAVANIPAQTAYQYFAQHYQNNAQQQPVYLNGIHGTIWSGQAKTAITPNLALRNVEWTFQPTSLLALSLGYHVTGQSNNGMLESDVDFGYGQANFTELRTVLPLSDINAPALLFVKGMLDGDINLNLDTLTLGQQRPTYIMGRTALVNLRTTQGDSLGDAKIDWVTKDDQTIVGEVSDDNGALELSGQIRLQPDNLYNLDISLLPTAETPPNILNMLNFLQRQADGSYRWQLTGILPTQTP